MNVFCLNYHQQHHSTFSPLISLLFFSLSAEIPSITFRNYEDSKIRLSVFPHVSSQRLSWPFGCSFLAATHSPLMVIFLFFFFSSHSSHVFLSHLIPYLCIIFSSHISYVLQVWSGRVCGRRCSIIRVRANLIFRDDIIWWLQRDDSPSLIHYYILSFSLLTLLVVITYPSIHCWSLDTFSPSQSSFSPVIHYQILLLLSYVMLLQQKIEDIIVHLSSMIPIIKKISFRTLKWYLCLSSTIL